MITKSKLETLIKQNATIYGIDYQRCLMPDVVKIDLAYLRYCPSNDNYQYINRANNDCYLYEFNCDDLYEDEESANFAVDFKNIPRTTYLSLPTYDDFKKMKRKQICFYSGLTNCFFELYTCGDRLILIDHDCDHIYFNEKLTKANYLRACKLAKKYFLGDED